MKAERVNNSVLGRKLRISEIPRGILGKITAVLQSILDFPAGLVAVLTTILPKAARRRACG